MDTPGDDRGGRQSRVQAQLSVRRGRAAVEFYQRAFGAVEQYRVGGTDEDEAVVAQLSVGDAWFWVADESPPNANFSPESLGGGSVRMLLIAPDPVAMIARAVAAGAREVYPAAQEHGWLLGRIEDPFGHHWEIGRPLGAWPPHEPPAGEHEPAG
jgi:PhnB protein